MDEDFVVLKTGRGELTRVIVADILYLKADGDYTHIMLKTGNTLTVCKNLKNTLEEVESDLFVKINRSIAVNRFMVVKLRTGKEPVVQLDSNETFRPSKKYQNDLKHIFVHTPTPKGSFHTVKGGVSHIYSSISHNNEKTGDKKRR